MFEGFKKFLRKLVGFRASIEKEVEEVITIEANDITNAVKLQLSKGIDGSGETVYLLRYGVQHYTYARYTEWRKDIFGQGLGSETDRITNYMTGRFYESLYVKTLQNGGFEVLSSSPLIGIIKYRSGENIINLSLESEKMLFENRMAPLLQQEIDALFYE